VWKHTRQKVSERKGDKDEDTGGEREQGQHGLKPSTTRQQQQHQTNFEVPKRCHVFLPTIFAWCIVVKRKININIRKL